MDSQKIYTEWEKTKIPLLSTAIDALVKEDVRPEHIFDCDTREELNNFLNEIPDLKSGPKQLLKNAWNRHQHHIHFKLGSDHLEGSKVIITDVYNEENESPPQSVIRVNCYDSKPPQRVTRVNHYGGGHTEACGPYSRVIKTKNYIRHG